MIQIADKRYTIGLEFPKGGTHAGEMRHTLRFCGNFIASFETRERAVLGGVEHAVENAARKSCWRIVSRVDHVLWLVTANGKKHRIAYGADIKDFTGKDAAAQAAPAFGFAVLHQAGCEGVLDHG